MGESIKRKKNLISIILVLGIIFSILGVTKYNKVKAYNRLISEGNKYLQSENYDKAIKLFTESLNYKNDSNVEDILINAKKLKNDKKFFDQGVDFSKEKKYGMALYKFHNLKINSKYYLKAKEYIKTCKKELLKLADSAFKNNQNNTATKYLDIILTFDSNDKDAKKLKNLVINKIKEENEAKFRKEKEEKKNLVENKKEEEKTKNIANNSNKANKSTNKNINKISKDKAQKLVESIKDKEINLVYLGIETVPYDNITKSKYPYKTFPKEIFNKEVYVFEGLYGEDNSKYAICQYYVDFSGHVYKDTYPSNLQCVKAKKATDEAKDDKISKKQAEDLAREVSKKDSEISKINYQGISKVPFDNIDKSKSPYRIFPKEIMNKEVYVFEGINGNSEDNYVTACMYYIDLGGNVYKDTLPSNGECIRIK
ncbi:hypothetical protein [Clostridium oceanicum]|uniref:Tetratricopeptide repeat protein n=1 Tax=Clostridium oceanicum TaxID=1543 RepID=A0ABN1JJ10_9CLOT